MKTNKVSTGLLIALWGIGVICIAIPIVRGEGFGWWHSVLFFAMPFTTVCLMATFAFMLKNRECSHKIFCILLGVAAAVNLLVIPAQWEVFAISPVSFTFVSFTLPFLFRSLPCVLFIIKKLRKNKIVGITTSILSFASPSLEMLLFGVGFRDEVVDILFHVVLAVFVLTLYEVIDTSKKHFPFTTPVGESPPVPADSSAELKKYEQLLARGLITPEEFEQVRNDTAK